jgi:hypothetical protein
MPYNLGEKRTKLIEFKHLEEAEKRFKAAEDALELAKAKMNLAQVEWQIAARKVN